MEEAGEEAGGDEGDGEAAQEKRSKDSGLPVPAPSHAIRPKPRPERVVKAMIDGADGIRGVEGAVVEPAKKPSGGGGQRVEEGGEDVDVAVARGYR